MKFFKNFTQIGDKLLLVEHDNGHDFYREHIIKPSIYTPGHGDFKTIYGQPLVELKYESAKDARAFARTLGDNAYGINRFAYSEINKLYGNDYDASKIRGVYIDIENAVEDKFPDMDSADTPINCITMGFNGRYFCYTTLPAHKLESTDDIRVLIMNSEKELLAKFIQHWKMIAPDYFSGWHSSGFDMPYLAKRIEVILGKDAMKSLSPFGKVSISVEAESNEEGARKTYKAEIVGVSDLDMMILYKKFRLKPRENYKLGYISQVELGDTKMELPGTFKEAYTNFPNEFVEYNIKDTQLVARIEQKLSMIDLALSVAYVSKTNYEDCLSNVRVWDVIIANYLIDRKIAVPYGNDSDSSDERYEGAYVKDPDVGFYDWVVSFDFESLYPRTIQTFNISPETMVLKDMWLALRPLDIVNKTELYDAAKKQADKFDATLCGSGAMFRRKDVGFIPVLAEMMFNRRKAAKKEMLAYADKAEMIKAEIARRGLNMP